ncbi:MAG: S-layer homology domain-containing protein, partial [Clostridia bacterium]|nr:S-layer homology domain-containing protein [Clostridia bacterium]
MKSPHKKSLDKLFCLLLVLVMALSPLTALADEPLLISPAPGATEEVLTEGFFNTSDDGEAVISMTNERSFKAVVALDAAPESADAIVWSLTREAPQQDTEAFPYQYLGDDLAAWTKWDSDLPLFTDITTELATEGDATFAVLTFSNVFFFDGGQLSRSGRNAFMDYLGDYDLTAKDAAGTVLGTVKVRFAPYDSFESYTEVEQSLHAAAAKAAELDGIHIEVASMGDSEQGRPMNYAIIADSKESIDTYLAMTNAAELDPAGTQAKIEAGELTYKIPVMFTNIHANEHPGVDANMNFIWALLASMEQPLPYEMLTGFTAEGEAQLAKEMAEKGLHKPELVEPYASYLGLIFEGNSVSGPIDMDKYYTAETKTLDAKAMLEDLIFIVVPAENADGRSNAVRQNGNGFDINRDNMFQTQAETQNMTALVAKWNPITLVELHGFADFYQIEPCSPPHEPNFEYDLFAEYGIPAGEAFGIGSIANSAYYNSFMLPLRDYLETDANGEKTWLAPWDDMSTNYTPQYSMLHGTVAYTIEMPENNENTVDCLMYGLIGHAGYVLENKDAMYLNQLEAWERGVNNIDADSVDPWYVDMHDNAGAEADVFRPTYEGNGKFFPEAYIIPLAEQKNPDAALEMVEHLLRNDVKLHTLKEAVTIGDQTFAAGDVVISMYQAKRNVANGALYDGALITEWPDLYSEPVTAAGLMRGFDVTAVDTVGAVTAEMLQPLTAAIAVGSAVAGEGDLIIDNNSVDAVALVNKMIDAGVKVGFITEGEHKGDFLVAAADYAAHSDGYVVNTAFADTLPAAKVIEDAKVYIPGKAASFYTDSKGNQYGVKNGANYGNTSLNFDLFAYGQQMGFEIVDNVADADLIAGNRKLDAAAVAAVKAGTPYLAAGENTLSVVKSELLGDKGFDYESTGNNQDALIHVTYGADSLVTSTYVTEGDDIYYAFGGALITAVPEGAEVLMTAGDKAISGFIKAENLEKLLGSVQAISYKDDVMNITVFANSLTNKAHQQDDYQFIANTLFANSLGADYAEAAEAEPWYAAAVKFVTEKGLMTAIDGDFAPDALITRADLAEILYLNEGKPAAAAADFIDLPADEQEAAAISWATEQEILKGYGDGSCGAAESVTREQLAAILFRYAQGKGMDVSVGENTNILSYNDVAEVSEWAIPAMQWACGAGVILGTDAGVLTPQGTVTRAQTAQMVMNLL